MPLALTFPRVCCVCCFSPFRQHTHRFTHKSTHMFTFIWIHSYIVHKYTMDNNQRWFTVNLALQGLHIVAQYTHVQYGCLLKCCIRSSSSIGSNIQQHCLNTATQQQHITWSTHKIRYISPLNSPPSLCKIWRGGGWFLAGSHCHYTSHRQVPPRHATPGSWAGT